MFQCEFCSLEYETIPAILHHMTVHQHLPGFSLTCPECTIVFTSVRSLHNHLRKKHYHSLHNDFDENVNPNSTNDSELDDPEPHVVDEIPNDVIHTVMS
jgi:hypothetical protein